MLLPDPRGPISGAVVDALLERGPVPAWSDVVRPFRPTALTHDDDIQLALWTCYELHYRGFDDVDDDWDSCPELLALRLHLERHWLVELRALAPVPPLAVDDVPAALRDLTTADEGPSMAMFLQRKATLAQFREFAVHRSVYHLKEADPHSWALPRLGGVAKAALVEIQADEYGGGRVERMHAELFRQTLRALGLNDTYGHYVDQVPAVTLAVSNLMSLFGLHRRWTPALLGHLAAFEMTSSLPNRRYGNGLRRLGMGADATRFYDEHVEADAVHEQIAANDLCGGHVTDHPGSAPDVLLGAACGLAVDREFARFLMDRWQQGMSSLRGQTIGEPPVAAITSDAQGRS
ncbi:MAG TPA: iron-containing redox enzyme family protein [Pseudonocardiaceae bacterium]|nr:iron-containing redox enzyme family protein [Pseudonocardiaceae bacterium]